MIQLRGRAAESSVLYAIAGGLMIGGPVWHYLYVNHYPFRPEAVALPLVGALVGAALAVAAHRIGGILETLGFAGLIYVFVDLQFNHEQHLRTVTVVAGCVAGSLLLRDRRALLVTLMLGTFNLVSLPRPARGTSFHRVPRNAGGPSRSLPVLIHIVLDEQWGVGGLRAAGDTATAAFLSDFYTRRGFEVYEGAYSRWNWTRGSLAALHSLGGAWHPGVRDRPDHYHLPGNPYFAWLQSRGYKVRVYQSTYIDFCRPAGVELGSCETWSSNSIASIGHLSGAWTQRSLLAARYFVNVTSYLYARLDPSPTNRDWRRSAVGGGLAALAAVRDAVASSAGGTAIFVHSMSPHQPLEVREDCSPQPLSSPRYYYGAPQSAGDSVRRSGLQRYSAQVRCTHRAVEAILAALDGVAGAENSIVIVQGDHGSRITPVAMKGPLPLSRLSEHQLNAMFSTLLAVRRPGSPAAVHREAVPLQDFFWALARQGFVGPVRGAWEHHVREWMRDSTSVDSLRVLSGAEMLWATNPDSAIRD
jgi:hypothetical protein